MLYPFTSWAREIGGSIADVASFFSTMFRSFPAPVVDILFLFPALSLVIWIVSFFRQFGGHN